MSNDFEKREPIIVRSRILIVGQDDRLQASRAAVLNQHWMTSYTSAKNALEKLHAEDPDLLVVCYTLSTEEAQQLIYSCRERFPRMRILALELVTGNRHLGADASIETTFGPEPMLKAAGALLADEERGF
jgi:DNA-binding response OmpR family regulator